MWSVEAAMYKARTVLAAVVATMALAAAACSNGIEGPAVGEVAEACVSEFCIDYPVDWEVVELGEEFISFRYPSAEGVVATVGRVNMEGVVVNAGGDWPQPARTVVDHLWSLLDGGEAELAARGLVVGGAIDSWGFISSGRLWHRLVPVTSSVAIGVEVRGPNNTWEDHADVFRQSVRVLNTGS